MEINSEYNCLDFHSFDESEDLFEEEGDVEFVEGGEFEAEIAVQTNCDCESNSDSLEDHAATTGGKRALSKKLVQLYKESTDELNNTVVTPKVRTVDSISDAGHYKRLESFLK